MRAAEVAVSGIAGVLGVSRREEGRADEAGGTNFVDEEDMVPGQRYGGRLRPSRSLALRLEVWEELKDADVEVCRQISTPNPWQGQLLSHPDEGTVVVSSPNLICFTNSIL